MEQKTEQEGFWNDRQSAEKLLKEISEKKQLVSSVETIKTKITDNLELLELLELEPDEDSEKQLEDDSQEIEKKVEELNLLLLLNGPYDQLDCILEVHSGAGGTEACDWAMMLYRMYTRWCEKKNYKIELLDYQDGEEAGIKSASIRIKGTNAYGFLRNEKGVHRLVRLSPFDSNNRRHTSFASIEVTPEIEQDSSIEIDEKDYISLTDMVKGIENGLALIEKWLRNKNTIEFLGIWEEMYNPNFNSPEFEGIKNAAGLNRFVMSVKQWIEKTNSIGIIAKAGRYGGTFAHKDIAFEFASWVSPQFMLMRLMS